ncbi:hypothetical protein [Reichenbachiella ulvae]|uniref:Glycosyl hydrolase family 65, N-terminal domain n=1 Tax=Reichenbachiella ulvae TaxID=2980104 RepID=A0ABT3CWX1_9BACT|nr:hypothetical protein [Reichenbachiella ulvae]MCV9388039.1 hypothetical protein [Reichenbachiella ulvae]
MKKFSIYLLAVACLSCTRAINEKGAIDREALVTRHNISHQQIDSLAVLTVGNGEFAYSADITGMQTFPDFYENGIPLGTQSQWGWHSFPNPEDYSLADVQTHYWNGQDSVYYFDQHSSGSARKVGATDWLRQNPHRLHLGLIGLEIEGLDEIRKVENPKQSLNLWTGELKSNFQVNGEAVEVITYCHQDRDQVAFRVQSNLIKQNKLRVKIRFPYASHEKFDSGLDFDHPDDHQTKAVTTTDTGVFFERKLDDATYYNQLEWSAGTLDEEKAHQYLITPDSSGDQFELAASFSNKPIKSRLVNFSETESNNREKWKTFWESGAAVDFSQCSDPRAEELERRVVLSQYLTKIQCTGRYPAQETGLTYNSWHGKFHLEMHWWHAAHFIKWRRAELITQQLDFYFDIYDQAKKTAEMQGYEGIRWPKMIDPSGRESPSGIGVFLIWQQPHIIYLTEALYQQKPSHELLKKYKKLVYATADFMASYARLDSARGAYVLGPALIPAQERFHPETTLNPAFELAYWYWGLKTALQWQDRMGETRNPKWEEVLNQLAPLPVQDGRYLFTEDGTDSYDNPRYLTDHPIVLGVAGFVPLTNRVDTSIMKTTQQAIIEKWDWPTTWGWDMPLAAMNANALGQPEQAVDFLLMDTPKNTYLMNGHNYQRSSLTLYLPGNGGLLAAIADMCISKDGWPNNGSWNVRYEGFSQGETLE